MRSIAGKAASVQDAIRSEIRVTTGIRTVRCVLSAVVRERMHTDGKGAYVKNVERHEIVIMIRVPVVRSVPNAMLSELKKELT